MRTPLIVTVIVLIATAASAQPQPQLNLMPMPASVQPGSGQLPIDQSFSVAVTGTRDASLDSGVRRFQTQLSKQTGIPFRPKPGAAPTLQIHSDRGRDQVQRLGEDESYELTIS
ncbi:MAG: glycoside hydrolase family 20 zincin-like fold domain-containing protein, partial [Candidatus Sulfotelmatobacter sp.]